MAKEEIEDVIRLVKASRIKTEWQHHMFMLENHYRVFVTFNTGIDYTQDETKDWEFYDVLVDLPATRKYNFMEHLPRYSHDDFDNPGDPRNAALIGKPRVLMDSIPDRDVPAGVKAYDAIIAGNAAFVTKHDRIKCIMDNRAYWNKCSAHRIYSTCHSTERSDLNADDDQVAADLCVEQEQSNDYDPTEMVESSLKIQSIVSLLVRISIAAFFRMDRKSINHKGQAHSLVDGETNTYEDHLMIDILDYSTTTERQLA